MTLAFYLSQGLKSHSANTAEESGLSKVSSEDPISVDTTRTCAQTEVRASCQT